MITKNFHTNVTIPQALSHIQLHTLIYTARVCNVYRFYDAVLFCVSFAYSLLQRSFLTFLQSGTINIFLSVSFLSPLIQFPNRENSATQSPATLINVFYPLTLLSSFLFPLFSFLLDPPILKPPSFSGRETNQRITTEMGENEEPSIDSRLILNSGDD